MAVPDIPPGLDLTDPDIYTTRVPLAELAELRRAAPVWWVAQRRGSAGFDDEGYWAVTRPADILAISKTPDVYSSSENTALIRFAEGTPRESIEMQRIILLNMDPPDHTSQRGIVSRGFTRRAIGGLRDALTARAELAARADRYGQGRQALGLGPGDAVAGLLPNGTAALALFFAAAQTGLYVVPVNWHLTAAEVAYILGDSGARAFVAHERFAGVAASRRTRRGSIPRAGSPRARCRGSRRWPRSARTAAGAPTRGRRAPR